MSDASPLEQRLALLFTPRAAHAGVLALDTVLEEIGASLEPTLNHTVAHTRLVWWREEVARLQRGAPLHPATRALLAAAPRSSWPGTNPRIWTNARDTLPASTAPPKRCGPP